MSTPKFTTQKAGIKQAQEKESVSSQQNSLFPGKLAQKVDDVSSLKEIQNKLKKAIDVDGVSSDAEIPSGHHIDDTRGALHVNGHGCVVISGGGEYYEQHFQGRKF